MSKSSTVASDNTLSSPVHFYRQDTCALTDQSALPRMTSDPTSQQGQHDATAVVVHQANNSNQANHNGKQKQLSGMEVLDKQVRIEIF